MLNPPFRPALLPSAVTWVGESDIPYDSDGCCGAEAPAAAAPSGPRLRLADLDQPLHCSVVGTCLSTAELRKLMRRFIQVDGASDLEVHHEAVRLTSHDAEVARTLHKALDRRHAGAIQRFAGAKDDDALQRAWDEALRAGDVPGAYWAVLTHRRAGVELRQRAFGDVHMLSHLVGAANRADIRRLAALERENGELRERAERQQERALELAAGRDRAIAQNDALQVRLRELEANTASTTTSERKHARERIESLERTIALQTQRREIAESASLSARSAVLQLEQELERLRSQADEMARELDAAEMQLRSASDDCASNATTLRQALQGRRLLYVGGRPSSNPAIRDLVQAHGGEYLRHDGGIEDRKGLLSTALASADCVVFPVDCVDHDSALALKRHCVRRGLPFIALRSASVASFAAGIVAFVAGADPSAAPTNGLCRRHA